jgi:chromate transporter
LLIVGSYEKFRSNRYVADAFKGLRPATIGLIAAAALLLMNTENFIDYKSILIFAAALVLTKLAKIHPMLMIVLAALSGLLLY